MEAVYKYFEGGKKVGQQFRCLCYRTPPSTPFITFTEKKAGSISRVFELTIVFTPGG